MSQTQTPSVVLQIDQTVTLTAQPHDEGQNPLPAHGQLEWVSSNPDVAEVRRRFDTPDVETAVVTAKAVGTCLIIARGHARCGPEAAIDPVFQEIEVTVVPRGIPRAGLAIQVATPNA